MLVAELVVTVGASWTELEEEDWVWEEELAPILEAADEEDGVWEELPPLPV